MHPGYLLPFLLVSSCLRDGSEGPAPTYVKGAGLHTGAAHQAVGTYHDLWRWHADHLLDAGVSFPEFAKCVREARGAFETCRIVPDSDPVAERCVTDRPDASHLAVAEGTERVCVRKLLSYVCTVERAETPAEASNRTEGAEDTAGATGPPADPLEPLPP